MYEVQRRVATTLSSPLLPSDGSYSDDHASSTTADSETPPKIRKTIEMIEEGLILEGLTADGEKMKARRRPAGISERRRLTRVILWFTSFARDDGTKHLSLIHI